MGTAIHVSYDISAILVRCQEETTSGSTIRYSIYDGLWRPVTRDSWVLGIPLNLHRMFVGLATR
jgi:hypothetical protein